MSDILDPAILALLLPAVFATALVLVPEQRAAALVNIAGSLGGFLAALALAAATAAGTQTQGAYIFADKLSTTFLILTTFVGFTTSVFSAGYTAHEVTTGRLTPLRLRVYHVLYQALLFGMSLALLSGNTGLLWVGVELATLSAVVMVGIYRTHAALEAAWKYVILGSVGIASALLGTILLYVAARPVAGEGIDGMAWQSLAQHTGTFDPGIAGVALVFLLLGYGTKAGLFPLHAWLPDAHAEGPTPICAILSGLLLNVALYALLRFKVLFAGQEGVLPLGPLMVVAGLTSALFGALMLYHRRDTKRLFAYSSMEHMGIAVFAFGIGGVGAILAGLLHVAMHTLTKSGIFFAVGSAAQRAGSQEIGKLRGLTQSWPALGWGLVLGVIAIAGLPPSGVFMSEFLVLTAALAHGPWWGGPALGIVLFLALAGLMLQLHRLAFGPPVEDTEDGPRPGGAWTLGPLFLHMAVVFAVGVFLPPTIAAWLWTTAMELR